MITFDQAAMLRSWSIEVELGGGEYTIPALPAADWLLALADGAWGDIVPGLLAQDDATDLDDMLSEGTLEEDEIRAAARDALTAAAGIPWWIARTLARFAAQNWVGPELLIRGVDPGRTCLGGYLAAVYHIATRNLDAMKRGQFDMELQRPPADLPPEEWFDEDAAADSWLAAAKGLGA